VPVYAERENKNPVQVARNSIAHARQNGRDVVILDTAGRLHIDQPLMDELRAVNLQAKPHQIFLVVDAMVGQDAVNSAKAFNEQLELDGIILTKFDSDTRGGAALSVKTITGKPIKFIGVGEKLDALEEFFPERIAQRMLGMGDILTLVEKAQTEFDEAKAAKLQEKMAKATFTLDDFLEQMRSVRKMGPLKSLLGMLPGVGAALKDVQLPEEELNKTEAIIQSMTKREREEPDEVDGSRRRRIAKGSGTQAEDVARLIKGFSHARDFAKKMTGMSMGSRMKMAQAMSQFDMSKLAPGGAGALPRPSMQQAKSRLSPEQKRKLREKRLRGK
jgi:signal recognition particle subunit SRP54